MAGGNVMLRLQFPDLFGTPGRLAFLDEIIQENYDAPSLTYPQVFDVRDSNRVAEQTTGITGFGMFSSQAESDAVEYDALLQAYDKLFTHSKFAKGFQVSEDASDDDIDNAFNDAGPALGRSAQVSVETLIWNVFNNGFTSEQTPDGASLFNTAHTLRGGGTFGNRVNGDISIANLEAALNIIDDMRDERGLPVETTAGMLLTPPELRWVATEILKSELRADTANNATNAFNQVGLKYMFSKYLVNATDWFVGPNDPSRGKLIVYWRRRPVTDHTMDFDTGNFKTKMSYRLSVGAADWRPWVGGDGT